MAPNVKQQLAGFSVAQMQSERDELARLLDHSSSEEPVHAFLAGHDHILRFVFAPMGRPSVVASKLRLGSEYVPDALLLFDTSHSICAVFVEFEPVSAQLYTKGGTESLRLRAAEKQIRDWHLWLDRNWPYFQGRVQKSFGACVSSRGHVEFKIVIGRRSMLGSEDNLRRSIAYLLSGHIVEVVTYDRFLDAYDFVIHTIHPSTLCSLK